MKVHLFNAACWWIAAPREAGCDPKERPVGPWWADRLSGRHPPILCRGSPPGL